MDASRVTDRALFATAIAGDRRRVVGVVVATVATGVALANSLQVHDVATAVRLDVLVELPADRPVGTHLDELERAAVGDAKLGPAVDSVFFGILADVEPVDDGAALFVDDEILAHG